MISALERKIIMGVCLFALAVAILGFATLTGLAIREDDWLGALLCSICVYLIGKGIFWAKENV